MTSSPVHNSPCKDSPLEVECREKPYKCHICRLMFASGTELEQHVQRHLDKPYECSICGGRFLQVSQLNKHLDNRTLGCLGKDTASKTSKPCDILEHNYELKNDVHGKQTPEHEFQDITDWYEVVEENSTVENICEDFKIDDVNEVNSEFSFVNKDNVKCVIKDEEEIRHEEVYFETSAAYEDAAHNKGIKITNDGKTLQCKCNKQNECSIVDKPHQCLDCDVSFSTRSLWGQHMKSHHEKVIRICEKDTKDFNEEFSVQKHVKLQDHNIKCVMRDKKLKRDQSRVIMCDVCSKTFKQVSHLNAHMMIHREEKPNECELCEKRFRQVTHLNTHMKSHGACDHQCPQCSRRFITTTDLLRHAQTHTGQQKPAAMCPVCKRVFGSTDEAKAHRKTHAVPKLFKCEFCDRTFSASSHLKDHMNSHMGVKLHLCTVCGKDFFRASHLKTHMLTHSEQKSHICTMCGKTFLLKQTLNHHMRIHTGEKPYACDSCDSRFRTASSLKDHQLTHTGAKDHRCSLCNKAYYSIRTLRYHIKVAHSSLNRDKLVKCRFCSERFSPEHLQTHMISHKGEKPYTCSVCGAGYANFHSFKKHVSSHDSVVVGSPVCPSCGMVVDSGQHQCAMVTDDQRVEERAGEEHVLILMLEDEGGVPMTQSK